MWEAAQKTANDLLARLAIVPMVLEARGLDVTPQMIRKLQTVGDVDTAILLQRIHDDEIIHVAIGKYWFSTLSDMPRNEVRTLWQNMVNQNFGGVLKPPFNVIEPESRPAFRQTGTPLWL